MKQGLLVAIFLLIMSSACTPPLPATPPGTISPTKAASRFATKAPQPAISMTATASALPATPYGLPRDACSPFRGPKLLGCILSFTVVPTEVVAGGSVTLTWMVTGTNRVGLDLRTITGGEGQSWDNLPVSDSLTIQLDNLKRGAYLFRLWADDPGPASAYKYAEVYYACSDTYFFAPLQPLEPGRPCPEPAVSTLATQQTFEHGIMIWLQSSDTVYALFDSNVRYPPYFIIHAAKRTGTAQNGLNAAPPPGKYQPIDTLGGAWQEADLIKLLGWAIAPEQNFTSTVQSGYRGPLYLRAADGQVIYVVEGEVFGRMTTQRWGYLSP